MASEMAVGPVSESDLIGLIYDAIHDSSRWRVFLAGFVAATGADKATFGYRDLVHEEFSLLCWVGWTDEEIYRYHNFYAAEDLWNRRASEQPAGVVLRDFDYCSREEIEAGRAFREFYTPCRAVHGFGALILKSPTAQSLIALVRSDERGPFQDHECEKLRRLMPHLSRAVRLQSELRSLQLQNAAFTGHLDRHLCLLDKERRVIYGNSASRQILARNDGLSMVNGQLTAQTDRENKMLHESIAEALRRQTLECTDVSRLTENAMPYRILLFPLPVEEGFALGPAQPAVAAAILDLDAQPHFDSAVLQRLFSLTKTESAVAARLAQGQSTAEIADEMHLSVETVRTHLRRIMARTRTHRQSALVSLVLKSASAR
ncbi:MAG TPA: helix-turn-helix transcriptional regulator [Bryobacteraceae bacterium]|nr:helix-turn-helix transcriptional regulator [Bryobacteraceae bacterium]